MDIQQPKQLQQPQQPPVAGEVRPYNPINDTGHYTSTVETSPIIPGEVRIPPNMKYLLQILPDQTPNPNDEVQMRSYVTASTLGNILTNANFQVSGDFLRELEAAIQNSVNEIENWAGYQRALSPVQILTAIAIESDFSDEIDPMKNGQPVTFDSLYQGISDLKRYYYSEETSAFMNQFFSQVHQQYLSQSGLNKTSQSPEVRDYMKKFSIGLTAGDMYDIEKISQYLGIPEDQLLPSNVFVYSVNEWFAEARNFFIPFDLTRIVHAIETFHYFGDTSIASKPFAELTPEQQALRRQIIHNLEKFSKIIALDKNNPQNLEWFIRNGGYELVYVDQDGKPILDSEGRIRRLTEEQYRIFVRREIAKQNIPQTPPKSIKIPKPKDSRTPPNQATLLSQGDQGSERHRRRTDAKFHERAVMLTKKIAHIIDRAKQEGRSLTAYEQRTIAKHDFEIYGHPIQRDNRGRIDQDSLLELRIRQAGISSKSYWEEIAKDQRSSDNPS